MVWHSVTVGDGVGTHCHMTPAALFDPPPAPVAMGAAEQLAVNPSATLFPLPWPC